MEWAARAAVRPAPQPIDLMRDRRASMREDPAWMLQIAGMTNMSSVDWPGKLTATLFLQGCPWECTYCHNPAMQDSRAPGIVGWDDVTALLDRRIGRLDGVVFSGGEPTRQRGLADAMRQAKEKGFGIGQHTAGAFPGRLAMGLPLVDIHAPVPGLRERIGAKIERFMAHLKPSHPVERFNWSLQADDVLCARAPQPDYVDAATELYYRTERQTLRRLPQTGAIVFTIRVYLHSLSALQQVPHCLARVRSAIASAPPAMAQDKHFATYQAALEKYRGDTR